MSFPRFHFQDAGSVRRAEPKGDYENECEAQGRDAGRQRFARSPQSNHMQGGGWNDESNPTDFVPPEHSDPRNPLRPNARPPEYRGRVVEPPNYTGRYGELPSANSNRNAGQLGTSVVSGPRGDCPSIGFSGAHLAPGEYDSRLNLSTVQPDGQTVGNHTANGMAGFRAEQMGSKATTSDLIRSINRHNKSFYSTGARDAGRDADEDDLTEVSPGEVPEPPEDTEPSITRWEMVLPDQSRIVHTREIHPPPAPVPAARTVDIMRPRYPLPLPHAGSAGARQGAATAARVSHDVGAIATMNRRNAEGR